MANYYASARSNYFKVKDPEAFKAWLETAPGLGFWEKDGHFAIFDDGGDSSGWPCYRFNETGQDDEELDLLQELSEHLADKQVAVLMEAGAEKLRYITGYAQAVSWTGEVVTISLQDIYQKAQEAFGDDAEITGAEY